MELYVGGFAQGKLNYVKVHHFMHQPMVVDGVQMKDRWQDTNSIDIWNNFHSYVRVSLEEHLSQNPQASHDQDALEQSMWQEVDQILKAQEDVIIISDDIGSGIVPMDATDRLWREMCGRLLCRLAVRCNHMERITAGIGQILK